MGSQFPDGRENVKASRSRVLEPRLRGDDIFTRTSHPGERLLSLMDTIHPWKCKRGHENRTAIAREDRWGARRRIALPCMEPDCKESTSIFVGDARTTPPRTAAPKRRRIWSSS